MVESILAVLVAILAGWNFLLGLQKKKAETKVRNLERERYNEKYEAIKKERELANKRLRDMLDNYRGPGKGQA